MGAMDTGYWSWQTEADGLCCYDSLEEAKAAAREACSDSEVTVYSPGGEEVARVTPSPAAQAAARDRFGDA